MRNFEFDHLCAAAAAAGASRRAVTLAAVSAAALLVLIGAPDTLVAPATAQSASAQSAERSAATPSGEAALPGPTDIDPIDETRLGEVLAASRGSVVLVNLWATWCAPCLKEIPELVELEHDLGPRGLRLIGISLDDVGSEGKIREFRDRWFPEFRTFYVTDEDWYKLVGMIDTQWSSILPTTFVIDRSGARVATVTGGQNYAAFEEAVSPHL